MKYSKDARRVTATLIASAIAVSLAGCAGDSNSSDGSDTADEPVTISFWDNNGGPARTPVYEELISRFEKDNPNITVDYVGIPAADAGKKIETAVAGGAAPDVAVLSGVFVSSLVAQRALTPLADFYAGSEIDGKIDEAALDGARGASPDNELYLMPATQNSDLIWYRSDLFEAAGLEAPQTWDEFLADARELNDPAAGVYGFAMRGGSGGVSQLYGDIFACSGLTEWFDSDGKSTFDDPAVGTCIDEFAGLYGSATSQADVNYAYPDMIGAFDSGSAAMIQHNLGSANDHLKALGEGVAKAIPLPAKDSSGERSLLGSQADGPAIFATSKHQDASWKFIEFLLSEESNSYWNENAGQIPTNLDARGADWVGNAQQVSAAVEVLNDDKTTVVPFPVYLPDYGSITSEMESVFQAVLLGKVTADDFANQLAERFTAAEAEFRANFGN